MSRPPIGLLSTLLLVCIAIAPAASQANGLCSANQSKTRFFIYENLQGSPGATASSYELDTTFTGLIGSRFNVAGGMPLYFTRGATGSSGAQEKVVTSGMGDAFVTLNATPVASGLTWTTCVTAFAPTGSSDLGLGTGRTLFNWNNHLEHDFAGWAPYADLGLANTTIARRVLKRPYTALGKVGNFDLGTQVGLGKRFTVDISAYADIPSGPQKIYSRLIRRRLAAAGNKKGVLKPYQIAHLTIGGPSLDRDNGGTAQFDFQPRPYLDLGFGYTRSIYQRANIVSVSLGWNVSDFLARY